MKTCAICLAQKEPSMFLADKRSSDGLRLNCKDCVTSVRMKRIKVFAPLSRTDTAKKAKAVKKRYAGPRKSQSEYNAYYRAANPEKMIEKRSRRRAAKLGASGSHSAADIKRIFEMQRGLCASCKTRLITSGKDKYHADHIMPLSLGGSDDRFNIQCLCRTCNLKKKAKDPIRWANENDRLI